MSERFRRELHETECQVAALTSQLDYANEHHRLALEALDTSNKEKVKLRQWVEAHIKKVESPQLESQSCSTSSTMSESTSCMTPLPITGPHEMPRQCCSA